MAGTTKQQQAVTFARHQRVLQAAKDFGDTFTCAELSEFMQEDRNKVSSSLNYLKKSGALDIDHKQMTRTGQLSYWKVVGEINRDKVREKHANNNPHDQAPTEPIKYDDLGNGVVRVRFGKYPSGKGQSSNGIVRGGRSPLMNV